MNAGTKDEGWSDTMERSGKLDAKCARVAFMCLTPKCHNFYPIKLKNFEALFFFEHIKKNVNEVLREKKAFFL